MTTPRARVVPIALAQRAQEQASFPDGTSRFLDDAIERALAHSQARRQQTPSAPIPAEWYVLALGITIEEFDLTTGRLRQRIACRRVQVRQTSRR